MGRSDGTVLGWRRRWGLLAVVAALALAVPTWANSGEYRTRITLLAHVPQGSIPAAIDTASGSAAGTASLSVALNGRVSGSLALVGRSVEVAGTLRSIGAKVKLDLRASGWRFRGKLVGTEFVGPVADRGNVLAGSGALHLDVSTTAALVVDAFLALPNGTSTRRSGVGAVSQGVSVTQLAVLGWVRSTGTRIRAKGPGFRFDATGTVAGDLANSKFACTAFGVSIGGTAGSMSWVANPPEVTLILASGHPAGLASDARPYLSEPGDAGPTIEDALRGSGRSVETHSFVDHYYGTTHGPGYDDLVAELGAARDQYVKGRAFPTRIVVVAHSHGGVRAHQAIHAFPDAPVRLLVDLDTSSCDFNIGHINEPTSNPVSAWQIGSGSYDDEEVVWPNVEFALEVRSNEDCTWSLLDELFDDGYNIRSDGTHERLFYFDAHSTHGEVHDGAGNSMRVVVDWILREL